MKQFVIIGLSNFGRRMLEELLDTDSEILIIDKNREVIEIYKDKVSSSYIADVLNEEIIHKIVPADVDAVIVDLGDRTEASILVTNYLKKMGIRQIIARAETSEHGEILELVGATRVVFPHREAARRIAPLLVSSLIFNYLPISDDFVIAEIRVSSRLMGQTVVETDLRRKYHLNVIAYRKLHEGNYHYFSPEYRIQPDDVLLVGGRQDDLSAFTVEALPGGQGLIQVFRRFFSR